MNLVYVVEFSVPAGIAAGSITQSIRSMVDALLPQHLASRDSWRLRITEQASGALIGDWGMDVDPYAQVYTCSSQPPAELLEQLR